MAYGSVPVSFSRLGEELLDTNRVPNHTGILERSTIRVSSYLVITSSCIQRVYIMSLDFGVQQHENTSLLLNIGNKASKATNSRNNVLAAQKQARANRILLNCVIIDLSLA